MADDLSSFFAKKTQKSKEKKKGVIKLDAVGMQLERKARRQEEMDREDEEEMMRITDDEHFLRMKLAKDGVEDSEWLDYNDPNKEIKLADFGIKDMNLTEQVELDEDEEEKAAPALPTKTWKVPAVMQDENKAPEDLPPPPSADGGAKYRPAHRRLPQHSATPDVNNQELFPSLAAAEQIEKHQKDQDKKEEQRKLEFLENQARLMDERQQGKTELPPRNPNVYQAPTRRSEPSNVAADTSPTVAAAPAPPSNPNAYVPPSRRGLQPTSTPMPPPPQRSAAPWGSSSSSQHAPPPPPTTTNRFDSLKGD